MMVNTRNALNIIKLFKIGSKFEMIILTRANVIQQCNELSLWKKVVQDEYLPKKRYTSLRSLSMHCITAVLTVADP